MSDHPVNLSSEILTLARELQLPEPVLAPLEAAVSSLPQLSLMGLADPLTARQTWEDVSARLPGYAQDGGFSLLAATLEAAALSRRVYRSKGIGDDVFLDTMLCIPRFLRETHQITGRWGYDRGFWTWRQTGGLLFRLGTLEFEYRPVEVGEPVPEWLQEGDPILSVHIPSDAQLTPQQLEDSYRQAEDFFRQIPGPWSEAQPKAILCGTWLLSPELYSLLPQNSGIRRFADGYQLYDIQENDQAFYRWLFRLLPPFPPAEQLPEQTRLQCAVKQHLLAGGQIGMARGILRSI